MDAFLLFKRNRKTSAKMWYEQWFSLGAEIGRWYFFFVLLEFCGLITLTAVNEEAWHSLTTEWHDESWSLRKFNMMVECSMVLALYSPGTEQTTVNIRLQLKLYLSFRDLSAHWSHHGIQPSFWGLIWPVPLNWDQKDYALDPSLRSHILLSYNLTFYTIAHSDDLILPLPTTGANPHWYMQSAGARIPNYV